MHQINAFMLDARSKLESVVCVQNATVIVDGATLHMVPCLSSAGNDLSERRNDCSFLARLGDKLGGVKSLGTLARGTHNSTGAGNFEPVVSKVLP